MTKQLLVVLVALALVSAACGDDSSNAGNESTTTTTTEAPPDAPDDPDDPDEPDAPDDPDEPVLTASDIGVTETAIRLGIVFPDSGVVGRDPGDLEAKFQVIADEINEAGGINGRTLELFHHYPNPLDDTAFEAACIDLVEDQQVFAVIGLLVRTNADCYAGLNDTPVISIFAITLRQMENYTTAGITAVAHPERLIEGRLQALVDGGVLAVGMKVAAVGGVDTDVAHDAYIAALEASGLEVVADTLVQGDGQDQIALVREMQTAAEVWQSSGAEAVLATSGLAAQTILIGYNNSAIDLPIVLPEGSGVNPSVLQDLQGLDVSRFERATALAEGDSQAQKYETGADGVRECVDRFQDASGEQVALDESRNTLGPTVVACQAFDIFVAVATAAGVDLTRETFTAAAESLGPITVTDLSEASLGPNKFDVSDTVGVIATFNLETVQFEPMG
jgi:ABC-type branched-subunit amino acid transport system substrate-binding protein